MLQEHAAIISQEINDTKRHVAAVLKLLDDGATVPFIARYRKEATGGMNELTIRNIQLRHDSLTELYKRRETVIDAIKAQGALTPELEARILNIVDSAELEDLYLPYKPRRRTRAEMAREAGLEPLARIIMAQNSNDIDRQAKKFVAGEIIDAESAIAGALDIIAEWVSENEKARSIVRAKYNRNGQLISKVVKGKEEDPEAAKYRTYFDVCESARLVSSHRYLAMRRGENEGFLKVTLSIDDDEMTERLQRMFIRSTATPRSAELIRRAIADSYKRLMKPSIENEIATAIKDRSDDAAISMFADNVSQLLMASPLERKRVLAIDPGYRTGCKIVCLDAQGNLLAHDVIYPTPPANDFYGASEALFFFVDRYAIDVIAIGNGTAGRETERFVSSLQFHRNVQVTMVSEQGASIYSASDIAIEEFPDLDVTVRGAISIGRRLIDPMAELVKIEPKNIGVGQYQHDVNQAKLSSALDFTVESCVNSVGVNLNTASRRLLQYVSGIGPSLAANIVAYRAENGPFKSRLDLMNVPRMGAKSFQQCAGFLRIPNAENILDSTAVHPESYELVERIAGDLGVDVARLASDKSLLHSVDLSRYATRKVGLPTLTDIILELEKPGRDPRVKVEKAITSDSGVHTINDLHLGMPLVGKVNNITAFGVFVDIGLKENGLIHISQLSDDFIQNPAQMVSMGQQVKVKVMDVDVARGRIALTMKGIPQS